MLLMVIREDRTQAVLSEFNQSQQCFWAKTALKEVLKVLQERSCGRNINKCSDYQRRSV